MSDNVSLKKSKTTTTTRNKQKSTKPTESDEQSSSSLSTTTSSRQEDDTIVSNGKEKICNKTCRSKRWSKSRHKYSGPPSIDPENSVAPLFVSNILDKI